MLMAMDRSARHYDHDNRLRVDVSNISKAMVCPYRGAEVPGHESLGLDPDKIYNFLRDPAEIKKAIDTFNGLPILNRHVPMTADTHQSKYVVGATGTDARFDEPYLTNSLIIWDPIAIKGIENKQQCELSSGYYYTPDMTSGSYKGDKYDGVMRNIKGNHVSLVTAGRAGSDVVVGDQKMTRTHKIVPVFADCKFSTMGLDEIIHGNDGKFVANGTKGTPAYHGEMKKAHEERAKYHRESADNSTSPKTRALHESAHHNHGVAARLHLAAHKMPLTFWPRAENASKLAHDATARASHSTRRFSS